MDLAVHRQAQLLELGDALLDAVPAQRLDQRHQPDRVDAGPVQDELKGHFAGRRIRVAGRLARRVDGLPFRRLVGDRMGPFVGRRIEHELDAGGIGRRLPLLVGIGFDFQLLQLEEIQERHVTSPCRSAAPAAPAARTPARVPPCSSTRRREPTRLDPEAPSSSPDDSAAPPRHHGSDDQFLDLDRHVQTRRICIRVYASSRVSITSPGSAFRSEVDHLTG